MHDCRVTKDKLIDLVFDELEAEGKLSLLAEVEGCQSCQEQYRSMTETLLVFNQAAEAAMPEESYWPGYEARLRLRLAEEPRLTAWQRLRDFLTSLDVLPVWSVPAAVALILIVLGIGWWLNLRHEHQTGKELVKVTPTPAVKEGLNHQPPTGPAVPEQKPGADRRQADSVNTPKPKHQRPPEAREQRREAVIDTRPLVAIANQPVAPMSYLNPETAEHIERSQLLLRSFKNASFSADDSASDLAYEKEQSRRLLAQNILLRRNAEAKGNLPAEEVLGQLEPFLLDIANLPDRPAPDEVRSIKERIQKDEIIAMLQVYSTSNLLASK